MGSPEESQQLGKGQTQRVGLARLKNYIYACYLKELTVKIRCLRFITSSSNLINSIDEGASCNPLRFCLEILGSDIFRSSLGS